MKVPYSSGGMTWFRVRRDGAARRSGWTDTAPLAELRERIGALPDEMAEVCVADDFRDVAANRFSRVFFNRARGRIGIELALDGEVERLAPTRMLTANLGFRRALEKFLESRGMPKISAPAAPCGHSPPGSSCCPESTATRRWSSIAARR